MPLLNFFIVIVLLYIFFRVLGRYILPYLVKRYINKQKEKFYRQNSYYKQKEEEPKKNGDIHIKNISKKDQRKKDNLGEYVDFEELDD